VRVEFHSRGFQQLLTSPETNAVVRGHADDMAERANAVPSTTQPATSEPYYEVQDGTDEKRARYRVRTASERAAKHEARTQALQRNI
jgi:hypothetical protein